MHGRNCRRTDTANRKRRKKACFLRYIGKEYVPLFGTVDWIMKNILFAASECVPFIKTGGLADVVGSLPKDFDKEKYDVRVVIPNYMCMKQEWKEKLEYVAQPLLHGLWQTRGECTRRHYGIRL